MMYDSFEKNHEAAIANQERPPKKEAKIKFPLIADDESLEKLLGQMIGPEEAQRVMYASDHASFTVDGTDTETVHESNNDGVEVAAMFLEDQMATDDTNQDKDISAEVMSAAPKVYHFNHPSRKDSSTSTKRLEDLMSNISGHRTELGNPMKPNNQMRWNSTKALNDISENESEGKFAGKVKNAGQKGAFSRQKSFG